MGAVAVTKNIYKMSARASHNNISKYDHRATPLKCLSRLSPLFAGRCFKHFLYGCRVIFLKRSTYSQL